MYGIEAPASPRDSSSSSLWNTVDYPGYLYIHFQPLEGVLPRERTEGHRLVVEGRDDPQVLHDVSLLPPDQLPLKLLELAFLYHLSALVSYGNSQNLSLPGLRSKGMEGPYGLGVIKVAIKNPNRILFRPIHLLLFV